MLGMPYIIGTSGEGMTHMTAWLAWRMNGRMLELVFLVGLGGVFLANAAVALVEPDSFEELVGASFAGRLIGGGDWIGPVVAGNDVLTGVAIIAAHRIDRIR